MSFKRTDGADRYGSLKSVRLSLVRKFMLQVRYVEVILNDRGEAPSPLFVGASYEVHLSPRPDAASPFVKGNQVVLFSGELTELMPGECTRLKLLGGVGVTCELSSTDSLGPDGGLPLEVGKRYDVLLRPLEV